MEQPRVNQSERAARQAERLCRAADKYVQRFPEWAREDLASEFRTEGIAAWHRGSLNYISCARLKVDALFRNMCRDAAKVTRLTKDALEQVSYDRYMDTTRTHYVDVQALQQAIAYLSRQQRLIIHLRYFEHDPWSLREISRLLGCSQERVRQIESKAIRKFTRMIEVREQISSRKNIPGCYRDTCFDGKFCLTTRLQDYIRKILYERGKTEVSFGRRFEEEDTSEILQRLRDEVTVG